MFLMSARKGMKMSQNQGSKNNPSKNDALQGEGNYTAAKEYDDATREFIKSGKVKEAADNAAPKNAEEEREMLDAEQEGLSHAKPGLKQINPKGTPGK